MGWAGPGLALALFVILAEARPAVALKLVRACARLLYVLMTGP